MRKAHTAKTERFAAVITAAAIISPFIFIQTAVQDIYAILQNTPISRKVRLNN